MRRNVAFLWRRELLSIETDRYVSENRERLADLGYDEAGILALARLEGFHGAKKTGEAAKVILDHVNALLKARRVKTVLSFYRWDGEDLYANDQYGRLCVILGSWWDVRYVLRGVVRQRARKRRWRFMCNGQASTGSVQVAYFGESEQLRFPEFEGIEDGAHKAMCDSGRRRIHNPQT